MCAQHDWEEYLDGLAVFGMRPGLERVSALLDALGRPQDRFRVVHIVGTNGKSSTARYAAAIVGAHGPRTGAYLSPHITGYCERVLVDGEPIGREVFGAAVGRVRAKTGKLPAEFGETTQFEVLTVAALLALAESGVEMVALEAGLGGRLDATNVTVAPVVVLTNIALEHTEVLGDSRQAIFAEKAAVIKGGHAVFGPLDGLEAAADEACARAGARAWILGREFTVEGRPEAFTVRAADVGYTALAVPSPAAFQVVNAGLAVMASHLFLGDLDVDRVREALRRVAVPGRLEVVSRSPLVLADGAHNPAGMRALAAALDRLSLPRPVVAVAAVMRDKDVAGVLRALLPIVDGVVCTQASGSRSLGAGELAAAVGVAKGRRRPGRGIAAELGSEEKADRPRASLWVEVVRDPARAVRTAKTLAGASGTVLVTGSLHLLEDLALMLDGDVAG